MTAPMFALALGLLALAQAEPPASARQSVSSPDGTADLELLEEVRRIASAVEAIRGRSFGEPPLATRAPEAIRRRAAEVRAERAVGLERLAARGRAWADIGLGDASAPRDLRIRLASDLGRVGLDAEARRVLVDPRVLPSEDFLLREDDSAPSTVLLATGIRPDGPAVAHVLTHLLRGGEIDPFQLDTTDAALAAAAWSEGEAGLVAVEYLFGSMGLDASGLRLDVHLGELVDGTLLPESRDEVPAVQQAFLDFVFHEGFARVAEVHKTSGWRKLTAAHGVGATTRDLLHPGRGAGRGAPEVVAPKPPKGFVAADHDVLGEQGVIVLVSTVTGKDNLGLLAGDGWERDDLYRWEPAGGDPGSGITLWVTRWASADEAEDFALAFQRVLSALHGRAPSPGPPGTVPQEVRLVLRTASRTVRMDRHGVEVAVRVAPSDVDARLEASQSSPASAKRPPSPRR